MRPSTTRVSATRRPAGRTVGKTVRAAALTLATIASFLGVAAAPAHAGKSRLTTVSCGQVITSSVRLGNDLKDCPGDGLIVGASDITIDLNGHTVDGNKPVDYGGGYGIIVRAPHHGVTIKNGTVQEFSFGIWLDLSNGNRLRRMNVNGNLIGVEVSTGSSNLIHRSVFDHNRDTGVRLFTADRNRVQRNKFLGGRWGVLLQVGADNNRVHKNTIVGDETSTDRGIQVGLNSNRNRVSNNRISGFDQFGINVDDAFRNVIRWNRSNENPGDGIRIGPGAERTTVARNVANDNGGWGIAAYSPVRDPGGNFAEGNGQPDQCLGLDCF